MIVGTVDSSTAADSSDRDRDRYRRAASATASGVAARAVALLTGLAGVPLVLAELGTTAYGVWATAMSLAGILTITDLGIGSGLLNLVAGAVGRGDNVRLRRGISTAAVLYGALAAAALVLGACLIVVLPWPRVFNVSPALATLGDDVIGVALVAFAVGLPLAIARQVRLGLQESASSNLIAAAASIIGLAAIVLATRADAPVWLLAAAVLSASVVGPFADVVFLFGVQRRSLRPTLRDVDRPTARELLRAGFFFCGLQVAGYIAFSSDTVVAAQVLGPRAVTEYSIPFRLFSAVWAVTALATGALWPAYAEAIARGDVAWVRSAFRRSMVTVSAAASLLGILLFTFGGTIVRWWIGPGLAPSEPLLLGFSVWLVVGSIGNAAAAFLAGAQVVLFQLGVAATMAIANIVASVFLASRFGVAGLIWGTVASYVVCTGVPYALRIPSIMRHLGSKPARSSA